MRASNEKMFGVWMVAESMWCHRANGERWTGSEIEAEYQAARMRGWYGARYEARKLD